MKGMSMFRNGFTQRALARFKKEEEGSLVVFSLFIFLTMLVFSGVAIDLMLHENRRTHVQNSTDRAVLAAANLDQTVNPRTVVKDYLAKVGIIVTDEDIDVQEIGAQGIVTGRQVSVNVEATAPTAFMRLVGVNSLGYGTQAAARESVNDVEISLVLDVSGSMGWGTKLADMQNAANNFVDGVLDGAEDNRVSISLIPYSTQVSAGPELLSRLVVEHQHNFSHCLNFEPEDFETSVVQRVAPRTDDDGVIVTDGDGNPIIEPIPLSQTASFDPFRHFSYGRSHRYSICRDEEFMEITPWSNNAQALKDQINDFTANGNTSIDVAMKWATSLLDPSMNGIMGQLQDDDDVVIDPAFSVRPHQYTYPDVLKFVVLMTDGINTEQFMLEEEAKEGMSDIYWAFNDHWIRVGERYWNMDRRCWHDTYRSYNSCNGHRRPDEDDRLTKLEMWNSMTMRWRAYNGFYRRTWQASDYYNELDEPSASVIARDVNPNVDTKDKRLMAICEAAKAQRIVVFTIGFEVTDESAEVMRECAWEPQYFYRVNGEDISYAFDSIRNEINQLKLTQ
jgi:hypothetical protein